MRVNTTSYTAWQCKAAERGRHRLWTGRHVWRNSIRDGRLLYTFLRLTEGGAEEGLWAHWWFCKGSRGAHQQKKSGEAIEQNAAAVMLYLGGKHSADHGGKALEKGEYMETKMPHSPAEDEVRAHRAASEDEGTRWQYQGSHSSSYKLLYTIVAISVTDVDVQKKFSGLKQWPGGGLRRGLGCRTHPCCGLWVCFSCLCRFQHLQWRVSGFSWRTQNRWKRAPEGTVGPAFPDCLLSSLLFSSRLLHFYCLTWKTKPKAKTKKERKRLRYMSCLLFLLGLWTEIPAVDVLCHTKPHSVTCHWQSSWHMPLWPCFANSTLVLQRSSVWHRHESWKQGKRWNGSRSLREKCGGPVWT